LLPFAVSQARLLLPCSRVVVVDSSPYPDRKLLAGLGVVSVFTPNVTLGFARQVGLLEAKSGVFVFLDDDVILEKDWFNKMFSALAANPKAVGASSKVIFGYKTNNVLVKLHSCSMRGEGASAGVSVLKRELALKLGGFNRGIHRSEDLEFELRVKSQGFKWLRVSSAFAFHPLTFREYLVKAKVNADGWLMIWKISKRSIRLRFLLYRAGSALFMPFYYGLLSHDPRVFGYVLLYKWKMLLTFLWRVN
jgi:GT2 family glycosyltransferase